MLLTALYCWSTWRDSYLEKHHWSSLDPQNISEGLSQRAHSQWENQHPALFIATLPKPLLGWIHASRCMLCCMRSYHEVQGWDLRIQNTKKLPLKHFSCSLEANLVSTMEKTKINVERGLNEGIHTLRKWRLRWNMIILYKWNEGTGEQDDLVEAW